ncbi:MAG: bifunctional phosphopantothenoylcysteine decarboxylase/phosphopantothenate--cysteine ligase CoaBC [Saprospiraceae bacterium]
MLKGKKILLGITGGIAAYKSAILCRLLVKEGASVRVIMTPAATKFIAPLTLATLSKHPVWIEAIDDEQWNNHVELGAWADLILIAPLTANTLAKLANGLADNLLTLTYYSTRCPIMVAPAMDLDMYAHQTVKTNLEKLQSHKNIIIPAEKGELASGLIGMGRMAEPETILNHVVTFFNRTHTPDLDGMHVLITAGPTYEDIDPVRFIGNRSSGKMGIAIADECQKRGADVVLILGPSQMDVSTKPYKVIPVTNAQSMYEAVEAYFMEDLILSYFLLQ